MPLPSIDIHLTQEIQDVFLWGTVALHEDHTEEIHQETGLGKTPATVHDPIAGEIHLADKDIRMLGSVVFTSIPNTTSILSEALLRILRNQFWYFLSMIFSIFAFLMGFFILHMRNRNCTNRLVCLVSECFPDRTLERGG